MGAIQYNAVTKTYPGELKPAVDALDLLVADGEFVVLVGPSGCGKTTSLRMLAGLEAVDTGSITMDDRDITNLPPARRDLAMVFQSYALYPHMSVAENIGFPLKMARIPRAEINKRVVKTAQMLDIERVLDKKPKALSGGQRQRVAMGRAIIREPKAFLMDEPLSNLDAKLRVQTRTQIASLQRRLGTTTIYVTHDQTEAMTLGDRVAVIHNGVLLQIDNPRALYARPANAFVAGFIGTPPMNLLNATLCHGGARVGDAFVPLVREICDNERVREDGRVSIGVRPEHIELVAPSEDGIDVEVVLVEEFGGDALVYTQLPLNGGDPHTSEHASIVVRSSLARAPRIGEQVRLRLNLSQMHAFAAGSGELIRPAGEATSVSLPTAGVRK